MLIKKAQGCFIEDELENKLIDTSMGSGAQIIGHGNELAVRASDQIKEGSVFSIPNPYTEEVSSLLKNHFNPGLSEKYVFCNSGTEANMRACRLARAFTRRDMIARFHGGWHGGINGFLADHPDNAGVPKLEYDLVKILPYNDEKCFDMIDENLAAVIVEPVQGSNPRSDIKEFLNELKIRCNKNGTLLILDEVMTGFRLSMRGGAEIFDIDPDIITYGKVLGGGFPIGAVGAKSHVMKTQNVFYGGTFSANPLSMFAAKMILETIIDKKLIQYDYLQESGIFLRQSLNQFFKEENISLQVMGCGPLNRIIFTDRFIRNRKERDEFEKQDQAHFYQNLKNLGVFINSNRLIHISMCHTKDVIDQIVEKIKIASLDYNKSNE